MPVRVEVGGIWHYAAIPPGPEPSHSFCGLELSAGRLQPGDFEPRKTDCPECINLRAEMIGLTEPRCENLRRVIGKLEDILRKPKE